jgi:adenine deaminase
MKTALEAVVSMGGGLVVTSGREILASLALPIAGLMSDRPLVEVAEAVENLHGAYHNLGGTLEDPFMSLSFLTLPVIPSLKLTDKGLVDVERFEIIPLFTDP